MYLVFILVNAILTCCQNSDLQSFLACIVLTFCFDIENKLGSFYSEFHADSNGTLYSKMSNLAPFGFSPPCCLFHFVKIVRVFKTYNWGYL